jgi:hypothetical protein
MIKLVRVDRARSACADVLKNIPCSVGRLTSALRLPPRSHRPATNWSRFLLTSAGVLCCTATYFSAGTTAFEWIRIAPSGDTPVVLSASSQNGPADSAFRQAFSDRKQPIFTRLAAISPALMALPPAEQDGISNITVAEHTASDHPPKIDEPDLLQAVSSDPRPFASFAGLWAPTANACSPKSNGRQLLPAVIDDEGAWAGEVSCKFRRIRRSGNVALITSTCSDGRQRWTAKVRLEVAGDRLKWSSERGSQNYVRCAPRIVEARAGL